MRVKCFLLSAALVAITSSTVIANDSHHSFRHHRHSMSFAVIGDGPYGDDKEAAYDRMIEDINRDRNVKFVIHVGDIKSGGAECTDERLIRRFKQLQQIRTALVYTPGDNEWTDCHRASNGGWNPLQRLDFIRNLFFPNPNYTTGQSPRRVLTQSNTGDHEKFVENVLFMAGSVAVSTIHVVGSNNNLRPWSGIDSDDSLENPRHDRLAEYEERNAASLHWLERSFSMAKRRHAAGVFIAIHADPNFDLAADTAGRNGFNPFLAKLFELSNDFDRPVVIAHGDSHLYRVDRPRLTPWYRNGDATSSSDNPLTPKLIRMEVFGDSDVHWVKVTANPRREEVFNFAPRLVEGNLPK